MPYDILILPLVGGYFILVRCELFKYRYEKFGPQRLLFSSVITGIILIASTFIVRIFINNYFSSAFNFLWNVIKSLPLTHTTYFGTTMFSFIFAITLTYLTNGVIYKIWGKKKLLYKAIDKYGNELERLFKDSISSIPFLVQVTLKNNKVYVGFIMRVELKKTEYVAMFPVISGHRESESKILHFITRYDSLIQILNQEGRISEIIDLKIVIKQEEILTANPFNPEIYERFQLVAKDKNRK